MCQFRVTALEDLKGWVGFGWGGVGWSELR